MVVENGTAVKAGLVGNAAQIDFAKSINARIDTVIKSEALTAKEFGAVSRDLITYITLNGGTDVGMVNRLIAGLTTKNRKAAEQFFPRFIPHKFSPDTLFGGRLPGEKRVNEIRERAEIFLKSPENNILTWKANEAALAAKAKLDAEKAKLEAEIAERISKGETIVTPPVDLSDKIAAVVKKALAGKMEGFDIMHAVFAGGVTLEDIRSFVVESDKVLAEKAEKAAKAAPKASRAKKVPQGEIVPIAAKARGKKVQLAPTGEQQAA